MIAPLLLGAVFAAPELYVAPNYSPSGPRRVALILALDGALPGSEYPLTAAEADARAFRDALVHHEDGFDFVLFLRGKDLTLSGINDGFSQIDDLALDQDDTLLVFFATHGTTCPMVPGDDGAQHLRVVETRRGEDCWDASIRDVDLLSRMLDTGAGRRVLVVDACMSEFKQGAAGDAFGKVPELPGRWSEEVVLRATSYGLDAYQKRGRMLYTGFLTLGLTTGEADRDGDGAITALELHDFAAYQVVHSEDGQVPSSSRNAVGPVGQNLVLVGEPGDPRWPVIYGLTDGYYPSNQKVFAMGDSGFAAIAGGGPLVRSGRFGTIYRVYGLPKQAGYHDLRPWMPGRHRGLPSVEITGAAAALSAGSLGIELGAPVGVSVRAREQIVPEIALSAEVNAWPGLLGMQGALGYSAHWTRWTLEPAARVGWLVFPSVSAGTDRGYPAIGGELSVRVGLNEQWGLVATVWSDRGLAFEYPAPDYLEVLQGSRSVYHISVVGLRLGFLVDPWDRNKAPIKAKSTSGTPADGA